MATKATKEVTDNTEEANDAPLAGQGNLADAIKKLLKKGKERGYISLDELNAILPPERISSEMIEDVMAQLNDMGINVVESDDDGDGEESSGETSSSTEEDYGRTDDPVRLYLREMGAVELLSREGEIAIAKRIEAGREMMISGICESPLTIQAILDWNEALKEGRLLLRDIIDLEATQETPEGGEAPRDDFAEEEPAEKSGEEGENGEGGEGEGENLSSFDDEDNISLAAIEEKLKPQVIETFDKIAGAYSKLGKLQHQRLVAIEKGEEPSKQSEGKMEGYKQELVDLVRTVRFNNARLEQLVQQLYTLNRRLMGLEGRLMRLTVDVGLGREDFLERYYGHELDPNWYEYILEAPPEKKPEPKPEPKSIVSADDLRAALTKANKGKPSAETLKAQKEAEKAAKEAEKAAAKAAAAEKAAAEKEAARLLKEKEAAKLAAEKEKAKIAAEKEKAKLAAEKEKAKLKADKEKAKLAADKEKARIAAEREKAKLKAEKEKAAAKKAAASAKKPAPKPAAKAAVKKPASKVAPAKKPVAKKPAPKPVAKKPAKPAPKTVAKAKPTAKKPAKPAPKPAAKKKR